MDERTGCVLVGGGPGGVVLGHMLARAGVRVTLLESRGDFDRRFRGDSIAPAVLDHLDRLGLADPMLAELPHVRADRFVWSTPTRRYVLADYRGSSERFPFYALVPQASFLPWLVERSRPFGLDVRMGARFTALVRDDTGRVVGVDYSAGGERRRLLADLVVGSDGRNSKVRQLADVVATELNSSIDICWISVPRRDGDPALSGLELMSGAGYTLAVLGQGSGWQIGFTIVAGTFDRVRAAGVEPLREILRERTPWLGDRVDLLDDVNDLTLLPIRITRTDRWSEPGLLLIGDAAHVISPVGGNGINFAVADAAEAANRLAGPLTAERVAPAEVDAATAEVERVRRPMIDREQAFQVRVERATARRLASGSDPKPPLPLRLLTAIPGFARFSGRRAARAQAVPAPAPLILHGRTPGDRGAPSGPGGRAT
ncbi:MAG TPA: FAD-dependent monooxygenase [Pseudonocardia sp.]|nr:FAD-dependent monooxygenase [Pseudonocardia sp.]